MTRFHSVLFFGFIFLSLQCKKGDKLPECPNCNFTCIGQNEPDVFTNDCKPNYTCEFVLHPDSKLEYNSDLDYNNYIKSGGNLVFKVNIHTEGAANIADDEFTDLLYFEMPLGQDSFSVENADLQLLNVRHLKLCFCSNVSLRKPVSGCMQGQKIDETHWQVQANLKIDFGTWMEDVKVDAVFEKL